MAITLSIGNVDPRTTALNIYRSVGTPVPLVNPGTPYATIAPASSWIDTDVVNYTMYHYRVEATDGVNTAMGDNQTIMYSPDTGPGANTLLRGDWYSGLMDGVSPDQFITGSDLYNWAVAQGVVMSTNTSASLTGWFKMAFRGKVLMVPNYSLGTATWMSLYNAGLIYGTNDMGAHPTVSGLTETNQRKLINIRGYTYIVRTMRAVMDKTTAYVAAASVVTDATCENYQVRVRLCNDGAAPSGPTRLLDATAAGLNTLLANPVGSSSVPVGQTNNAVVTALMSTPYAWLPVLEFAPGL